MSRNVGCFAMRSWRESCVTKIWGLSHDHGFVLFRYHGFPYSMIGDFLDPNICVIWGHYCSTEILSKIHTFSSKKMHLTMPSAEWWPFCSGLNVLPGAAQFLICIIPDAFIIISSTEISYTVECHYRAIQQTWLCIWYEIDSGRICIRGYIYKRGTPYLWGVFCEDLGENWPRYNNNALYFVWNDHPIVVFQWTSPPHSPHLEMTMAFTPTHGQTVEHLTRRARRSDWTRSLVGY